MVHKLVFCSLSLFNDYNLGVEKNKRKALLCNVNCIDSVGNFSSFYSNIFI